MTKFDIEWLNSRIAEFGFSVGEPTNNALSVTGEEYVVIGLSEVRGFPGVVPQGETNVGVRATKEEAMECALLAFKAYAEVRGGLGAVLYWRIPPRLEQTEDGRWMVYMRGLISDKPRRDGFGWLDDSGNIISAPLHQGR